MQKVVVHQVFTRHALAGRGTNIFYEVSQHAIVRDPVGVVVPGLGAALILGKTGKKGCQYCWDCLRCRCRRSAGYRPAQIQSWSAADFLPKNSCRFEGDEAGPERWIRTGSSDRRRARCWEGAVHDVESPSVLPRPVRGLGAIGPQPEHSSQAGDTLQLSRRAGIFFIEIGHVANAAVTGHQRETAVGNFLRHLQRGLDRGIRHVIDIYDHALLHHRFDRVLSKRSEPTGRANVYVAGGGGNRCVPWSGQFGDCGGVGIPGGMGKLGGRPSVCALTWSPGCGSIRQSRISRSRVNSRG